MNDMSGKALSGPSFFFDNDESDGYKTQSWSCLSLARSFHKHRLLIAFYPGSFLPLFQDAN
jgi:hypothetical protein